MGKEFIKLLEQIISPQKTWACWSRKTISAVLAASIGAYGFNAYREYQAQSFEALDLHEAVVERGLPEKVQANLESLLRLNPRLASVWLYSWYDGRNMLPVQHAGHGADPFPLGYFTQEHALQIGKLVLGQCVTIDLNVMCPIMADNDAYGVLIFVPESGALRSNTNLQAFAHKLTILIYHDHD